MAERNAKGNGSVRQRPDGTWEARCSINGKRRSFYGEKQADALKVMREAQKSADDKTYCDPTKMTFGEWLDIWMEEYVKPSVKRSSYETWLFDITSKIKPKLGNYKLQDINTTQIQHTLNKYLEKLSGATVKSHIYAIIYSSFEKAIKCGYLIKNPAQGCSLPKITKKNIDPFTDDEISVFLKKIEKNKYKNLFKVALFTGMRQGEILGLPWDAVDFQKGTITVKQQLQPPRSKGQRKRENCYISTTKNGKERVIFPPLVVMDALKEVRSEQLINKIHAGIEWKNKWDLVFTNSLGDLLVRENVTHHFKKIVRTMDKPDMRFHDLRHTYAVMAFRAGIDPKTVQNTLGHHTAAFTLEVYAHVTEDMNKNSANKIQDYCNQLNA